MGFWLVLAAVTQTGAGPLMGFFFGICVAAASPPVLMLLYVLRAWFGFVPTSTQIGYGVFALVGGGVAVMGIVGLARLRAGDEGDALASWAGAATIAGILIVAWLSLQALDNVW